MAVGLHSKPLSPAQLGNPKNDMRVTNNCLSVTLRVPRAGALLYAYNQRITKFPSRNASYIRVSQFLDGCSE